MTYRVYHQGWFIGAFANRDEAIADILASDLLLEDCEILDGGDA